MLISTPTPGAGSRLLLALLAGLSASFAYLCHLVPGLVALGTVALFALGDACRQWSGDRVVVVLLLALLGTFLLFGTGQLGYMKRVSGADGELLVRHLWLLVLWVPTVPLALWDCVRIWRSGSGTVGERTTTALTCLLVIAGLLQAYCAWAWAVQGTAAVYAVKKLFHYTFPAASLLWFVWIARRLQYWQPARGRAVLAMLQSARWARGLLVLGLMFCAFQTYRGFLRSELRRPYASPERHPLRVGERLARQMGPPGSCIYLDPELRSGAVFVNATALGWSFHQAHKLCRTESIEALVQREGIATILLAADADASAVFGVPVTGTAEGPWTRFAASDVARAIRSARGAP